MKIDSWHTLYVLKKKDAQRKCVYAKCILFIHFNSNIRASSLILKDYVQVHKFEKKNLTEGFHYTVKMIV